MTSSSSPLDALADAAKVLMDRLQRELDQLGEPEEGSYAHARYAHLHGKAVGIAEMVSAAGRVPISNVLAAFCLDDRAVCLVCGHEAFRATGDGWIHGYCRDDDHEPDVTGPSMGIGPVVNAERLRYVLDHGRDEWVLLSWD